MPLAQYRARERMHADADKFGNFDCAFKGGAKSFLFKGINGRWRTVLTKGGLQRYRHRVEEFLTPDNEVHKG